MTVVCFHLKQKSVLICTPLLVESQNPVLSAGDKRGIRCDSCRGYGIMKDNIFTLFCFVLFLR